MIVTRNILPRWSHKPGVNYLNMTNLEVMILVIDDDVDDFDIIAEAIRTVKPSAKLAHCDDPEECLMELQRLQLLPTLILLDINMPKMTGVQFLQEFRKNISLSKIPVVILSTLNEQEQKKNCASLGAVNFISKGKTWQELIEIANTIISLEATYS
jgi:CheY-like chemotaxis protein